MLKGKGFVYYHVNYFLTLLVSRYFFYVERLLSYTRYTVKFNLFKVRLRPITTI